MKYEFDVLSKDLVYNGFFKMLKYRVKHTLFSGAISKPYNRELLERGHAVAVFLHDPALKQIVLIEQFRIGAIDSPHPWVIELVAGMVEEGESPQEVAQREVEEECGSKAGKLQIITQYYNSVGGSSEKTTIYYSQINAAAFEGTHGLDSENEDIRIVKMKTSEFINKLKANEFCSATLVTAGYWFLANRQELGE